MSPGDLIAGRYRLLRPVGAGATGTVWAARHEHLGREYALKIAAGGRATEGARAQWLREVRIVGTLRHRNIVDIADAGEAGEDRLYLAMELLDGESLAERIARGPLPPGEAIGVMAGVCRGLAAAHAAGVVHRDVKPENIFLARVVDRLGGATTSIRGVVPKLLDFGVSSARGIGGPEAQRVSGTPAYMSPEQAAGEAEVDHRVDLWAVGVVLYEMLTGRHPFEAESYLALLPQIIEAPYPPLPATIPAEVSRLVAGCLAKRPADRYATAGDLLEAVELARAALPEGETTHSAFFLEATEPMPASTRGSRDSTAGATRRAQRVLWGSIVAALVAIGAVAALMGARRRVESLPSAAAASGPSTPTPASPASIAPAPAEPPLPSATAAASAQAAPSSTASARPGKATVPAAKGGVTRVNSAGF